MKNYEKRDLSEWTVRDYHDYMTARTREKFGVDYVPFGKGPISTKWRTEQGQIKNAQKEWGNDFVKYFIDHCISTYSPTSQYPLINFGFMYAYKREDVPKLQRELETKSKRKKAIEEQKEVDADWF